MSKPKPALPERLYYRLADAANYLGCSADDLLHLGVQGNIEIMADACMIDALGCDTDPCNEHADYYATPPIISLAFVSLYPETLLEIEVAGKTFATSRAWKVLKFINGELGEPVPYKDYKYFEIFSCLDREPCTFTANDLWVLSSEVKRALSRESASYIPRAELERKPHGNAERFACNRESVLKAAMAVKANFPDLCGTYRDWAETIDAKAPFFWPETGIPPLKPETIERLLSDSHKLPDGK